MAYAHCEMFLYRPFLHYVSQTLQAKNIDKRSYACAAACVSVSRNIVHLTTEMKKQGLLVGSYWFYMYTTFFSIISLVFFVLENPRSQMSESILKDAYEGKDTLAGLAAKSHAADRCSKVLAVRATRVRTRKAFPHTDVYVYHRICLNNFLESSKERSILPHNHRRRGQHPRSYLCHKCYNERQKSVREART